MTGCYLSGLTWIEARASLRSDSVVVLPLGAAAKKHGPHLQLDNGRAEQYWHADRGSRRGARQVELEPDRAKS